MPSGTAAACTTLVCSAAWPLALVRQLLRRGNTVIVTGRDQDKLAATMRSVPDLHEAVLSRFPALDTLIINAGIMRNLKLADERDLEDVTREIEINLSEPVRMVQQFLPQLRTRPGALIVNVSASFRFGACAARCGPRCSAALRTFAVEEVELATCTVWRHLRDTPRRRPNQATAGRATA